MRNRLLFLLLCFITLASISCGGGGTVLPHPNGDDGRVSEYTLLYDSKICRWDKTALPLDVYIDPPPADAGGAGPGMMAAVIDGIDTWDGTVTGIPDLFNYISGEDSADIIVRWETMNLSGYTRATEYSDHIAIHKIALSSELRDTNALDLIMAHELGHVLGLNLSGVSGDLMFSHVYPNKTAITKRDRDMINWLYSQVNYIPIRTY